MITATLLIYIIVGPMCDKLSYLNYIPEHARHPVLYPPTIGQRRRFLSFLLISLFAWHLISTKHEGNLKISLLPHTSRVRVKSILIEIKEKKVYIFISMYSRMKCIYASLYFWEYIIRKVELC